MTRTSLVALTLLHFVWQGALIHGVLAVLLRLAKQSTATVRYAMGVSALALMALAPIATTSWLARSLPSTAPTQSYAALEGDHRIMPNEESARPGVQPDAGAAATPTFAQPVRDAVIALAPLTSRFGWMMPWLVGLWLAGVVVLAIRLLGGWLHIRGLVRGGWLPDTRAYDDIVRRLQRRFNVERPIRVLESAFVRAPAVIGWLRPALLHPASMSSGLTVAQLEMILAHEIAHIRRHDYAVNLLQSVIETLLFYHPGVWWVSRQIRQEREHCCDDLAVATSGDARAYAAALLELETQRLVGQQLAVAATGGNLLQRVRRLVTPRSLHGGDGSRWLAGVLVLATILLVGGGARLLRANAADTTSSDAPNEIRTVEPPPGIQLSQASARPDTVILYSGNEALGSRWSWAHATARQNRFQSFWIGYVVKGDVDRGWVYFDRQSPVRTVDGSMFFGHMRMKDGFEGLIFSGTRLDSLVPSRAPTDVAILMSFVMRGGRAVLDRVHAGNFAFPVHLDKRALVWRRDR
jgi:beta-lactamase regulating signal transducer with metallopeptidase domain